MYPVYALYAQEAGHEQKTTRHQKTQRSLIHPFNPFLKELFPDTVSGVVLQREKGISQFSPVANGSFYRVKVSEETISAVGRALMGEDISQGALYFAARKYADSGKMKWFDENLTYLFVHGGHEFFR